MLGGKEEKLPSSNKELVKLAGKYSYVKNDRGHYVSETYENNSAAYELCKRLSDSNYIWKYCAPFVYGEYASNPEYKLAVDKYRKNITPPDPDVRLFIAVRLGDEALVKEALDTGGNPNKVISRASVGSNVPGNTSALTAAYALKDPLMIKLLLESGANVNSVVVEDDQLPVRLSGEAEDNNRSLDLMLQNGYDISYDEVEYYNGIIFASCGSGYNLYMCGLKDVLLKGGGKN